jgi:hypothetical protein
MVCILLPCIWWVGRKAVSICELRKQTPTFRSFYGVIFQQPLYCHWAAHWTILITVCFSTSRDIAGRPRNRVTIADRDKLPNPVSGPPSFLVTCYLRLLLRGQRGHGFKLTTHLNLVARLRMNGAVTPLHHTPSWRAERQHYLIIKTQIQYSRAPIIRPKQNRL